MSNLLQETLDIMQAHDKSPDDVRWCGNRADKYGSIEDAEYSCSWNEFAVLADREYDEGHGGQEVADDLVIVGEDWWLERHEYDGSEWWEFKTLPQWKSDSKPIQDIFHEWYSTLKRIHEEVADKQVR